MNPNPKVFQNIANKLINSNKEEKKKLEDELTQEKERNNQLTEEIKNLKNNEMVLLNKINDLNEQLIMFQKKEKCLTVEVFDSMKERINLIESNQKVLLEKSEEIEELKLNQQIILNKLEEISKKLSSQPYPKSKISLTKKRKTNGNSWLIQSEPILQKIIGDSLKISNFQSKKKQNSGTINSSKSKSFCENNNNDKKEINLPKRVFKAKEIRAKVDYLNEM